MEFNSSEANYWKNLHVTTLILSILPVLPISKLCDTGNLFQPFLCITSKISELKLDTNPYGINLSMSFYVYGMFPLNFEPTDRFSWNLVPASCHYWHTSQFPVISNTNLMALNLWGDRNINATTTALPYYTKILCGNKALKNMCLLRQFLFVEYKTAKWWLHKCVFSF